MMGEAREPDSSTLLREELRGLRQDVEFLTETIQVFPCIFPGFPDVYPPPYVVLYVCV